MTAIITRNNDPKSVGTKGSQTYLYSWSTTNGVRPTILLELLEATYYLNKVDISKKIQKEKWYLEHNANGKIPTLAWIEADGSITYVNESAAILLFLAEKLDKKNEFSFKIGSIEYYEDIEWLFFVLSGLGPNKSNWKYFSTLPVKNDSAIKKYRDELLRNLGVVNTRLQRNGTGYLVGKHIGLADIALYPWIRKEQLPGLEKEIEQFPYVKKWIKSFDDNANVQKGYSVFKQ